MAGSEVGHNWQGSLVLQLALGSEDLNCWNIVRLLDVGWWRRQVCWVLEFGDRKLKNNEWAVNKCLVLMFMGFYLPKDSNLRPRQLKTFSFPHLRYLTWTANYTWTKCVPCYQTTICKFNICSQIKFSFLSELCTAVVNEIALFDGQKNYPPQKNWCGKFKCMWKKNGGLLLHSQGLLHLLFSKNVFNY